MSDERAIRSMLAVVLRSSEPYGITDDALRAAVRDAVNAGRQEVQRLRGVISGSLSQLDDLDVTLAALNDGRASEASAPFVALAGKAREQIDDHIARQQSVLGTFNIALFGRTGAGKSSLLSALAELDGSRVSRGESDWTVEVEPVSWEGCLLYDTPGINGWGRTRSRSDLEETARQAVEVADVVLLCFDSQSQQASEFSKVAEWVREFGKPTIAVLNCRNLMWRHPARVRAAGRANLSKAVRQHAGNIADSLSALGMAGTPVIAIHTRHAVDARAAQPYAGPDANNHHLRREQFGTDYLYRWSNLPVLQEFIATIVRTGGSRLRLRVLREGMRTTLRVLGHEVDVAAESAIVSRNVLEETIEAALGVLGYPEVDQRGALAKKGKEVDRLSSLEIARGAPFRSPAIGRLETHVIQLATSELGVLRNQSLKIATKCVRSAFDDQTTLSEEKFKAAVFDDIKIRAAAERVESRSGAFLARELGMTWDEARSDLAGEARRIKVDGASGHAKHVAGETLHVGGVLAGGVGAVLGVIALTNWWNPGGWVAAAIVVGIGVVSSVLGWLGKRTKAKAERQRLAALGNALAEVRLAVGESYDAMQDLLRQGICREAWQMHTTPLSRLLDEALVVRGAVDASTALAQRLRKDADAIKASPSPGMVIQSAERSMLDARLSRDSPDDVWLGEDWLESADAVPFARSESTLVRLRELEMRDRDQLIENLGVRLSRAQPRVTEEWLARVEQGAVEYAELGRVAAEARHLMHTTPKVAVVGDYSAGKSSLIKRLLAEAGVATQAGLQVGAEPTTSGISAHQWRHLSIEDTPGLQSGRSGHDCRAASSVDGAALILVVLHVNLLIGDFSGLKTMLEGSDQGAAKIGRTVFLINRSDEFGVDPGGDPDEFIRRRTRKESELRDLLAAHGLTNDPAVHTVAGDPFGLVGDRPTYGPADYQAEYRAWDGIAALTDALITTERYPGSLGAHAAVDHAASALIRHKRRALDEAAHASGGGDADFAMLREVDAAIDTGHQLSSSLQHRAEATVRTHAQRWAAAALAASGDALEQVSRDLATWWADPQMRGAAVTYWSAAQREIDDWQRRTRSAVYRSTSVLADSAMGDLNLGREAPHIKRGRGWLPAGPVPKHARDLLRVGEHRDVVYKIGKAFGHKFKPWGAVKGAAKVAKVGAVLGVVAVGFDIASWVADRKAAERDERDRSRLTEFIEASIEEVVAHLTTGTDPLRPLTVLESVLAELSDARDEIARSIQTREASVERLVRQSSAITDLLAADPTTTEVEKSDE